MSRRRVVVTGLGLISPVGNTVAEGWANIVAGRSGIATITKFDASPFACRFSSALPLSYSVTLDVSLAERSGLTFERELRSASDHPKQTLAYVASTRAG